MADESRVQQLLDEIFDSERTPEEVCDTCPELLPEVRRRWRQMRLVDAELEALFPTPGTHRDVAFKSPADIGTSLPRIPGYDVEAVLGFGGMGVVYRARHLRLNRRVALKMLVAGVYAGPHERARLQREAEAVASLHHSNIIQVHDVGDHEGRPYFTMELVEGGSLAHKLAGTPQPARAAAALAATLAGAMQVAHQGGIVHRDLKPANILLTADGIPKIADFGLARHLDGGPALTLSGARLGTPSYMAPEQVIGKPGAVGPAADIYALGALLYEMLTGRPPFRGETAMDTERQVVREDPVSPSRLNGKVPRDLETICLKCLHKAPQRRYPAAAALAEDLERFQRGLPVAARPAGLPQRTAKWVRRHPTAVVMAAAGLLLAALAVGGSLWFAVQQAHRRDAVEADLRDLVRLQEGARWAEARAALKRAEAQLDGGGPDDLRGRLGRARHDLDLVIRLDKIRLKRVTRGELAFYKARASQEYADAFQEAGLGTIHDPPSGVAKGVEASAVREALVAALYDWAVCAPDRAQRAWLLEVARHTEPAGSGPWRERFLDASAWETRSALAQLARTAPVASEPVSLLLALGEWLRVAGGDAAPFLQRVQREHPEDFWANLIVGNAMLQWAPQEAAGYYRAALASRPGAAVGYCAVGDALRLLSAPEQAFEYYEKALRLEPDYVRAHSNLGDVLQDRGQFDLAIEAYGRALQLDPDYAWAHHNLANALLVKGRLDEANGHYLTAIRLDPRNPQVVDGIRSVLLRQGRGLEAQVGWRKVLAANPPGYDAWAGYAELCLFLGQQEEYCRARRDLLKRFGATTAPALAEPVGRACLLLPGTADELSRAVTLMDRAASAKGSMPGWVFRYVLFARGLAAYRQGRFADTISLMSGEASQVMGPSPRLILAMAQNQSGQKEQARKSLAAAVVAFDWSASQADRRDVWIAHILRREAEALILPNLPAFLRGEYQPVENDERLALVGICQSQGRSHAAARLYADAWTADPPLTDDLAAACRSLAARGDKQPVGRVEELAAACRYPAARCAALAGCGLGSDGAALSAAERTAWRKQAREWLKADLAVWAKSLAGNSQATRVLVSRLLMHWQADPDLAGMREPSALSTLTAGEQAECVGLWSEVAAVLRHAQTTR
jgi:serine/threonine-protein kinase